MDLPYDPELERAFELIGAEHRLAQIGRDLRELCQGHGRRFDPVVFLLAYKLGLAAGLNTAAQAPVKDVQALLEEVEASGIYQRVRQALDADAEAGGPAADDDTVGDEQA